LDSKADQVQQTLYGGSVMTYYDCCKKAGSSFLLANWTGLQTLVVV